MTLSQLASLFNVSAVMVVLLISTWVVSRHSRPFFTQWVIGYGIGAVLMTLQWLSELSSHPAWLVGIELLVMPQAAWYFFQSGNFLAARPRSRRTHALFTACLFAAGLAIMAVTGQATPAFTPALVCFSAALIYLGVMLIRHTSTSPTPSARWYLGAAVALLGIVPVCYPVLQPYGLDWVGFWVSGLLHMLVGSSMIIFVLEEFSDQLKAQNQRLLELDELKSHFVSTVSHELRTPLTSIVGYLELMEDGVGGHLSSMQREYVETMRTSADHLAGLVDSILDSMRLQRGALTVRVERVELYGVVESLLDMLFAHADKHQIRLDAQLADDLPDVQADATRVTQVLNNLVGNAIKFTPPGGVVTIRASRRDGFVRIEVADTGIGIAPDQIERVFEPFVQVDGTLTRSYGGTGLGLSIVKDMVKEMDGEVGLTSTVGVGSTFWFTLPVMAEAPAAAAAPVTP